jgi:hypothetical protein
VAAVVARHLTRARRSRLTLPQPTWAEDCQLRLDHIGAARGRPRRGDETVFEYAAALRDRSPPDRPPDHPGVDRSLPDRRLERVATLVSAAAFSGELPATEERRWVDGVLEELDPAGRDSSRG